MALKMDFLRDCQTYFLKPGSNLKPCGITDPAASPLSDVVVNRPLSRNAIFLGAAAGSTIAQLRYKKREISAGDISSRSYQRCLDGMITEDEKKKVFGALSQDCEMDTYAELKLIEKRCAYAG
jgi:hypothetical protein